LGCSARTGVTMSVSTTSRKQIMREPIFMASSPCRAIPQFPNFGDDQA
jgi:hypothetical protein